MESESFDSMQNDLIHAWGLDRQLGYCAQVTPSSSNNSYFLFIVPSTYTLFDVQGDRTKNVGIVDSEYIIHLGLPTLGVLDRNKAIASILFLANKKILKGLKQHLCWSAVYLQFALQEKCKLKFSSGKFTKWHSVAYFMTKCTLANSSMTYFLSAGTIWIPEDW